MKNKISTTIIAIVAIVIMIVIFIGIAVDDSVFMAVASMVLLLVGCGVVALVHYITVGRHPVKTTAARVRIVYPQHIRGQCYVDFLLPNKMAIKLEVLPQEHRLLIAGDVVNLTFRGEFAESVKRIDTIAKFSETSRNSAPLATPAHERPAIAIRRIVAIIVVLSCLGILVVIAFAQEQLSQYINTTALVIGAIVVGGLTLFLVPDHNENYISGGSHRPIETDARVIKKFPVTSITSSTVAFQLPNGKTCTLDMTKAMYDSIREGDTVNLKYSNTVVQTIKLIKP
ncbi:MAG: DUF2500 domain-containing protein [Defluviitaleaceae bacterium]|nr:DUF2500 domain-containing protein [Defluviitaleaceae bacterium]